MWEILETNSAAVNRTLQLLPESLLPLMHGASFLGVELFYLALVPVVFWGISRKAGVHLLVLVITTAYTNSLLKWLFSRPRPYWISSEVTGFDVEHSFGIPSGHSQNAVVVWFFMAALLSTQGRRALWYSIAAVVVFLISFSRMVLGVHFLQDVLCGWAIGALILILDRMLSHRIPRGGTGSAWMLAIPFLLIALGYLVRMAAVARWPGYDALDPGTVLNTMGTLLALLIIYVFAENVLIKEDSMSTGMRIALILMTFVLVMGVRAGLSVLFSRIDFAVDALRFVRYTAVGLVGFYVVPMIAARMLEKRSSP
jgi:antibiotic biosynthesis monooxygenase (ABM) superfamily enzyme